MLVEGEKVLDAGTVVREGLLAVAALHGAVERLVGLGQSGRHRHGIVEIGEGWCRCRICMKTLRLEILDYERTISVCTNRKRTRTRRQRYLLTRCQASTLKWT